MPSAAMSTIDAMVFMMFSGVLPKANMAVAVAVVTWIGMEKCHPISRMISMAFWRSRSA